MAAADRDCDESLVFDLPGGPATLGGAAPLRAELACCLLDWSCRPAGAGDPAPCGRARPDADGYRVAAGVLPEGVMAAPDRLAAANILAGVLTAQIPARDPQWVQLHAAAATLDARGVSLFLGASGAGKSTLALGLALARDRTAPARRPRLFADDRLSLRLTPDGAEGLALAVAPKMRLPLPAEMPEPARARLARRTLARRDGLLYLDLPPAELARLGERAPVTRLVLLRRGAGPEGLRPAGRSEALQALLESCFAPGLGAGELLAWGRALLARLPGPLPLAVLGYRDAAAAATFLRDLQGAAA